MKIFNFFLKSRQFIKIQKVLFGSCAKDEVDVSVRDFIVKEVMAHAPEGSNACSGTDKV